MSNERTPPPSKAEPIHIHFNAPEMSADVFRREIQRQIEKARAMERRIEDARERQIENARMAEHIRAMAGDMLARAQNPPMSPAEVNPQSWAAQRTAADSDIRAARAKIEANTGLRAPDPDLEMKIRSEVFGFADPERTEHAEARDPLVACGCGNHTFRASRDPYVEHRAYVERKIPGEAMRRKAAVSMAHGIGVSDTSRTLTILAEVQHEDFV